MTDILELAELQDDFEKLDTRLMVISTDAVSSHSVAWYMWFKKLP